MRTLHLVVNVPDTTEETDRRSVVDALLAAGWTTRSDRRLLRKNDAVWALDNNDGDSTLVCPNGAVISFTKDVQTVIVVCTCIAAADSA